jgi:hypothetical protein
METRVLTQAILELGSKGHQPDSLVKIMSFVSDTDPTLVIVGIARSSSEFVEG